MKTIRVEKEALIGMLHANRDKHRAEYEAAQRGFCEQAATKLGEMLAAAQAGSLSSCWLDLTVPESHVEDYDRALQMLEWHQGSEIELDAHEFRTYVQDDWGWKEQWSLSNSAYVARGRRQ